jgi:hypothetical protein
MRAARPGRPLPCRGNGRSTGAPGFPWRRRSPVQGRHARDARATRPRRAPRCARRGAPRAPGPLEADSPHQARRRRHRKRTLGAARSRPSRAVAGPRAHTLCVTASRFMRYSSPNTTTSEGETIRSLLVLVGCLACPSTACADVGCRHGMDCKGDRICEGGRCISPTPSQQSPASAPVLSPPPASPTVEPASARGSNLHVNALGQSHGHAHAGPRFRALTHAATTSSVTPAGRHTSGPRAHLASGPVDRDASTGHVACPLVGISASPRPGGRSAIRISVPVAPTARALWRAPRGADLKQGLFDVPHLPQPPGPRGDRPPRARRPHSSRRTPCYGMAPPAPGMGQR